MWTEERVEALKKLWADGLSCSQIANEIGGVSRNAVIGKAHRIGLAGRAKPAVAKSSVVKVRQRRAASSGMPRMDYAREGNTRLTGPVFEAEPVPEVDDNVIPFDQRLTLQQLKERSCRWPIGDPQHEDFRFCGSISVEGLSYCPRHCRIAYQPPAARAR